MKKPIPPIVTEGRMGQCDSHEVLNHPAFGTISVSVPTGGDSTLFGSDIGHNERVCIRITTADVRRDLSRDWIHPQKEIVELEMSHAQFAQFISSHGNYAGTPCTLRWIRDIGEIPGIANVETKHETFRREINDAAKKRLEHIRAEIAKLGGLIESGKLPKKELRDIQAQLRRHVEQLPGSMEFVVKSAEEALEKATSDAKIEVESFVQATAQRLGLRQISDLARLEHEGKDGSQET